MNPIFNKATPAELAYVTNFLQKKTGYAWSVNNKSICMKSTFKGDSAETQKKVVQMLNELGIKIFEVRVHQIKGGDGSYEIQCEINNNKVIKGVAKFALNYFTETVPDKDIASMKNVDASTLEGARKYLSEKTKLNWQVQQGALVLDHVVKGEDRLKEQSKFVNELRNHIGYDVGVQSSQRGFADNVKLTATISSPMHIKHLAALNDPQVILTTGGLLRSLATIAATLCVELDIYNKEELKGENPDYKMDFPLLSWSDEGLVIKIPKKLSQRGMHEAVAELIGEKPIPIKENNFGKEYTEKIIVPYEKVFTFVNNILTLNSVNVNGEKVNIFDDMIQVNRSFTPEQRKLIKGTGEIWELPASNVPAVVQEEEKLPQPTLQEVVKPPEGQPNVLKEPLTQAEQNRAREYRISKDAKKIKERLAEVIPLQQAGNVFTKKTYPDRAMREEFKLDAYAGYVCATQGSVRDSMEDYHFHAKLELQKGGNKVPVYLFGVFDGHNGFQTAEYANTHFKNILLNKLQELDSLSDENLWNAFKLAMVEMNEDCKKHPDIIKASGSTALISVIINEKAYVVNLGDSRAVFSGNETQQLSEDAKPRIPKFKKTVENRGGFVALGGVYDPASNALLGTARALGDLKIPGLTGRPKIIGRSLEQLGQGYLVLACDGLWDVVGSTDVQELIKDCKTSEQVAKKLHDTAFERNTRDNLTIVAIALPGVKKT